MSLKTYNVLSIFCIIFIVGIYSCGSPGNEKRFSLKRLFNSSSDKEEIFIDQHIDWSSVSEYQEEVKRLYADRNFMPVWINDESLNDLGVQLTSILKSSWEEGLPEPVVYLERVEEYLLRLSNEETKKDQKAQLIAVADVSLTQAYFDYASNLSSGIINPKELNVIWEILPGEIDLVKHLEHGINRGNLSNSLQQLRPKHEQYVLLLEAFKNLMQIKKEGGWPVPGPLPVMKKNDTHNGLVGLKKYLTVTGDLNEQDSTWLHSIKFDNNLSEAIKRFQFRHGLEQDGTIGQLTLKMMNVSIDDRIDQIRLNLDRIRWYPEDFGRTHIKINIPAFSFEYFKNGKVQQEMKVVVGQNENYTPVLEDTLYAVVFNPVWNVPNSISTHEIFPKMLEDNTYLKRNHYSILKDSYVSTDTIDYQTYDWQEVSRDSFPFFIVQHPGPLNSLGRVQFLLENQYSIFLHDTPANHLFNIEQRDFSHGCVRLERPAELAVTLLKDQLPKDTIIKYLSEKEKKIIRLEEKIPVHLTYQTAWMDDDDRLHFREDIYGFDELSMPVLRNTSAEIALKKD